METTQLEIRDLTSELISKLYDLEGKEKAEAIEYIKLMLLQIED